MGQVLGPNRPDKAKKSECECGFEPFGEARMPFDERYCLVSIFFIFLDLEMALLLPWAVSLREIGPRGF